MEKPNIEENEEGFLGKHAPYGVGRKTFITSSKKFTFTKKAIAFSVVYSVVLGLALTIIGVALFMSSYYEDAPLRVVGYVMLVTFLISSILIFILRITAKRGMQIFSISLIGILALIIIFFWAIVPKERAICNKLDGTFKRDSASEIGLATSSDYYLIPAYTCFVSEEVMRQVSSNESFPYNFMNFEVRK